MATIHELTGLDRFLTKFLSLLNTTDLADKLRQPGSFTLFAPVNLAFERNYGMSFTELHHSRNKEKLSAMLADCIMDDKRLFNDFRNGELLRTMSGKALPVKLEENAVYINGSKILSKDRQASNGVLHCVNAFLATDI